MHFIGSYKAQLTIIDCEIYYTLKMDICDVCQWQFNKVLIPSCWSSQVGILWLQTHRIEVHMYSMRLRSQKLQLGQACRLWLCLSSSSQCIKSETSVYILESSDLIITELAESKICSVNLSYWWTQQAAKAQTNNKTSHWLTGVFICIFVLESSFSSRMRDAHLRF